MKTLRLFSLLVRDYEEAIRFYTDKLGFTVSEDVTFGEDRWVVLGLRDSGEPGLALTLARTEERPGRSASRQAVSRCSPWASTTVSANTAACRSGGWSSMASRSANRGGRGFSSRISTATRST